MTATEQDRLSGFLDHRAGEDSMNLEEMDGFFTALIVGPELVPPSEYLPAVFGGPMSETCEFESMDEANEILGLIMRHWNAIADDFDQRPYHLPFLWEDDLGESPANDWALGFMRGIDLRPAGWEPVIQDDVHAVWVFPMMMLAHEHDEDPEMRPPPLSAETREDMIHRMVAGAAKLYEHFRKQPGFGISSRPSPVKRVKVGRNDPCPCKSGKKYKRCCGSATVH